VCADFVERQIATFEEADQEWPRHVQHISRLLCRQRDCLKGGGQAAIAACGSGSLAGWNLCPKPEPSVPL
jgi:hypothetical protein